MKDLRDYCEEKRLNVLRPKGKDVLGCNVVLQVYQIGNNSMDNIGVKKS